MTGTGLDADPGVSDRAHSAVGVVRSRTERWIRWIVPVLCGAVVIVNTGLVLAAARATSQTSDEFIHRQRLRRYFVDGWYVPDQPEYGVDSANHFVYAPATALLSHVTAVLTGAETWGSVSFSPGGLFSHRLGIVATATVGLGAVALTCWLLLGSWRWGLVGAALLSGIPMFMGHAVFNVKDVPVASAYMLVTGGLVALVSPESSSRRSWAGAIMLGTGSWLLVGTRPAMWPAIFVGVVVAAVVVGVPSTGRAVPSLSERLRRLASWIVPTLAVAALALWFTYPNMFSEPLRTAIGSVTASVEFDWQALGTLTNGELMEARDPPIWYLPIWLVHQMPLLTLALGLIGLTTVLLAVTVGRRSARIRELPGEARAASLLVVAQLLALPAAAVVTGASMYNAMRQFLFVVPALAVLATVGAWYSVQVVRRMTQRPAALGGMAVILAVALLVPLWDSLRLYPYMYTYLNELATLRPINGNWETDYYYTALGDTQPLLEAAQQPGWVVMPTKIAELPALRGPHSRFDQATCRKIDAGVTRPLRGQDIVMIQLSLCRSRDPAAGP